MRTEDGYLVSRCLNGEPEAFGFLVDRYKESVYSFAYARLGNFHDAEDVAQEVFIKAYQKLRTLKRWDSFHAWIYSVTANTCKNWLRAKSRRPDREYIEDEDSKAMWASSMDSHREELENESLHETLHSLPEIHRQVLTLHYFGGMSTMEIARFLGTSPNAIIQRLYRARAQLKEEMLAMMSRTFEEQRLPVGFTIRVVEMVKRMKIHPTPRTTGLPWGLSLAAGIILAILSFSSSPGILEPAGSAVGSPLPSQMRVLKVGEIPVDVLEVSEVIAISSQKEDGSNGDGSLMSPQAAVFMAPDGEVTFTNVAREAGLTNVRLLKSLTPVWGDYDNDGDLDLYVTHGGWAGVEMEADVFYRNNGDGTFTDVTAEAGLDKNTGDGRHAGFLDYDNDGYLDLYVSDRKVDDVIVSRIILYHNNGDGTFVDVTKDAGIKDMVPNASWSSTYADFDNDGDLDIYVAVGWGANVFYENEGNGQFTDATKKAGLGDEGGAMNMASGDYDDDGDVDIYISNGTGLGREPVTFYRNNGDGTFTDVTEEAGLSEERNGRAVAFFDYDNDGDLDIFAGGQTGTPTRLYRNNGDSTFTDAIRGSGISSDVIERFTVGDYDNDGYMDIFELRDSDELYHNNGDGTFTEVAKETGVRSTGGSIGGCTFVDYDNDGDLDLQVLHINSYDDLYRNDGNDNHWLHIKLVGTESNRDGVGARVVVKARELSMMREINPGCAGGRNSLIAYFGLGQNTQADSIEIRWPTGPVIGTDGVVVPGRIEVFQNVPADRFIMIEEGSGNIVEVKTARAVQPQGKLPGTWGKVKKTELLQNYPNPFNPETWIPYQLGRDSSVAIKIHTPSGQLVRTLELGDRTSGLYTDKTKAAHWDGTNESGESVASGVYFYTIQTDDDYTDTKKMVIAR